MKTIFFFIACSCLINGLTASFPGASLEDEETSFDRIAPQLDILFPDVKKADSLIVPYPTDAKPTSTTPSTTTTSTTTTRPPRPPRPTFPTGPPPTTTTTTTTTSRPTRPPRPTRPTRPTPTTSTTTTTTTTTPIPTRPPRPTRPTRPTRPPTSTTPRPQRPLGPFPPNNRPRPEFERAQIYKNAYRSLGPLAGRLVNIVSNSVGSQNTDQKNEIMYNLRYYGPNGEYLDEEN